MEENKDIDNLFKSGAEPFEMEPTPQVWASLDKKLAAKKPAGFFGKNIGVKYFAFAVVLLFISYGTYRLLTPDGDSASIVKSADEVAVNNVPSSADPKEVSETDKTARLTSPESAASDKSVVEDAANNSSVKKTASVTAAADVATKHEITSTHKASGIVKVKSSGKKKNTAIFKEALPSTTAATESKNSGGEGALETSATGSVNQDGETAKYSAQSTAEKEGAVASGIDADHALVTKDPGDFTSAETKVTTTPVVTTDATSNTASATSVVAAKGALKRFSVEAFYAPEITNRNGNSSGTTNSSTTTSEEFNSSYNTGLQFRFDVNNHLSIALGASYSTLDYSTTVSTGYILPVPDSGTQGGGWPIPHGGGDASFMNHFKDPNYFEHYFTTDGDDNIQYNSSLGSVHLYGSPTVPPAPANSRPGDEVYFKTNTVLTLQYINIPLSVRYKLTKNKLDYYATAGVSANFLISKKALVSIGDSYTETSTEIDGLQYVNYSYIFGIGMQYHLSDQFGMFLEPAFRGSITPINTDGEKFYPYHFGLKAGLSFHF